MKTTDYAIDHVYRLLTGADGVDVPVWKHTKPATDKSNEYIVLNALPINAAVVQFVRVNVNYYAKDTNGTIDTETLQDATADLMGRLTQVNGAGIYIDFESQQYVREASIGYHFTNIRLFIKIIN
jgi:hypothetical protein